MQCCSPSLPLEEARGKLEAFAAAGSVALPALCHRSGRQVSTKKASGGGEKVPFPLLHKSALPALFPVLASTKRKNSKGNRRHHPWAKPTAQLSACQPPQERAVSSFTGCPWQGVALYHHRFAIYIDCPHAFVIPISKS